ncbi:DEAD-box ATP-dependent RNA helicase 56-like [Histomonas meleagridis]|uniref:DEAD-box ATP-dependent RNA helicase 56-like n=1 Tax=Histomonas meleagridis TaxID=135588 RepID=UPI00355A5EA2|nr:DEAD-box ATP-dependent RNA helicase 56-like [Histomonas meleagridis]KAH0803062.1 DEAD-box ATP-dependent RNA helicase 56-like [Histomonas meleagridis]
MADHDLEDELLNYEEVEPVADIKQDKASLKGKGYVGTHSAAFRDFLLKPEIMRAINDNGFEHPSQVQQDCIPQALLGTDIICQGKSGMGKTAVFVISVLQQLDDHPTEGEIACLCIAPTRELAFQICSEFKRFSVHMNNVKAFVIYGGISIQAQINSLKQEKPNIIIATPGRLLALLKDKHPVLDLSKVRFFVVDECDQVFENSAEGRKGNMKDDVEKIFRKLPQSKQTLLFTATMPESMKEICRKFTRNAAEVFVDDDKKLTLHGLQQFYIKLQPAEKNRKLIDILDNFTYNQVVIFVSEKRRAETLNNLLNECGYPSIAIHSKMAQPDRIKAFRSFKEFKKKILVSTDVFARGIDVERVNIVINYDLPNSTDTYLHRVGRAGRFGTKGLAISFVSTEEENTMLNEIQKRFEVEIQDLPATVDAGTYMNA